MTYPNPDTRRPRADHSAEHEALLEAVKLALGVIPGTDFEKLTNYHGTTDRGTHISAGMRPGAADLIGQVVGRRVDLEIKTGDAEQTAEQATWQHRIRAAGGICEVVRSVDEALRIVRAVIADVELRDPQLVARVRENHAGRLRLAELEKARSEKRADRAAKKLARANEGGSLDATRECARGASTPGRVTHRKVDSDE